MFSLFPCRSCPGQSGRVRCAEGAGSVGLGTSCGHAVGQSLMNSYKSEIERVVFASLCFSGFRNVDIEPVSLL